MNQSQYLPLRYLLHAFLLILISSLFTAQACGRKKGSATIQVLGPGEIPILGAYVHSHGLNGKTENFGYLHAEGIPEGTYTVRVDADGFAPSYHNIRVRADQETVSVFHLLPIKRISVKDLSTGKNFEEDSVKIRIPDNALPAGAGTIEVAAVVPGQTDLRVMPGEFNGLDSNGKSVLLETAGALSLKIKNGEGKELQLKKPITLIFPYDGKGGSIPLWSFDEISGNWKEEGKAELLGNGGYLKAKIQHLSWWNLDQPIRNKTAVWVKSFVNEDNLPLYTPGIQGNGINYSGISYPYSYYGKFEKTAPVLAGECMDVKIGSKIHLSALFFGTSGGYEYSGELSVPNKSSSCRTNPQDGLVMDSLVLKRIPSSCVRGRAVFKNAKKNAYELYLYMAPETLKNSSSDYVSYAYYYKSVAKSETDSNGNFCLDHVPSDRSFTMVLYQDDAHPERKYYHECEVRGKEARIEIHTEKADGFSCIRDYEKCLDLGDLTGELDFSCGGF